MKKFKGKYSEGGFVGGDPIKKNKREVKTSENSGVLVPMDDATKEYNLVHDMAYLAANPDGFSTELGKSFFKRNSDNKVDPALIQGIVTDLAVFNAREDVKGLTGTNRLSRFLSTPSANPLIQELKTTKKYNPAAMLNNSPDIVVQETEFATGGVAGSLLQQVPAIADSVIGLLENNPNAYSTQPTFSASTMRTMVSPYNNFATGGMVPIEVEGDEAIQTPDGQVMEVNGPSHEQGGVDVAVPAGSKIYSDRVTIDGKTMQERKLARERRIKKLVGKFEKNPQDKILKNTLEKTAMNISFEEEKDMAVQEAIRASEQRFATGGIVDPDPVRRKMVSIMNSDPNAILMGSNEIFGTTTPGLEDLTGVPNTSNIPLGSAGNRNINVPASPAADSEVQGLGELGVGDIVGMAGTAFNAIAPLINSANAAKNSRPNVNRFQGFGQDALDANQQAQGYVDQSRTNQMTNLRTSTNAQLARNRNSANSVNTLRALDIASGMAANQAVGGIENSYNAQMMQLLGQQAGLENEQDRVVMSGEQQRDLEDKMDLDNYYSNKGANLVNFGTNVQGIGRALNIARSNKIDANLISQLSRYGLSFDKDGNLVSKNK